MRLTRILAATTAAFMLCVGSASAAPVRVGAAFDPPNDVLGPSRGTYDLRAATVYVDDRSGRIGFYERAVHTPIDERPLSIGRSFTLGHVSRGRCDAPATTNAYDDQPLPAGTARVQWFTDDGPPRVTITIAGGPRLAANPYNDAAYYDQHVAAPVVPGAGWTTFTWPELKGRGWDCVGQYRTDGVQGTDLMRGFRLSG